MRITTIVLTALAGSSALLLGCARCAPCQTINVAPSPEELPQFPPRESTICATVAVEGGPEQCRPGLVPEFKEPELTPEEKEALCIQPEPFNWLEFYVPKPCVPISPDLGGPAVGSWGLAVEVSAVGIARQPMAAGPPLGPISGESILAARVAEHGNARPPAAAVGLGEGGASVGEDRASKVAAHSEQCDP
jgi:hypothetical protein